MKGSEHRSLSTTISISFLTITLASLLVSGTFQILFHFRSQTRTISEKQFFIAKDAAGEVENYILEKLYGTKSAMTFTQADFNNGNLIKDFTDTLISVEPSFRNVVLLDEDMSVINYSSRQSTSSLLDFINSINKDDFYEALRSKKDNISSVLIDPDTNEPLIVVYIPWLSLLKEVDAVIVLEINLKFMWDLIYSLNIGETGELYVINQDGRIIASKDSGRVIRSENLDRIPIVKEFIEGSNRASGRYKGLSGKLVVGEYIALPDFNWAVIAELPIGEAYSDVINTIIVSITAILVLAITAVLVGIQMSRYISLPIKELTSASMKIARGNLEISLPVKGSYEIAELSEALNIMTANLKSKIEDLDSEIESRIIAEKELDRAKKYISNIINSMPSQIIGVSTDLVVTQWNLEAERATGISSENALGKRIESLIPSLKSDMPLVIDSIKTKQVKGHYKVFENSVDKELYKDIYIYPLIANGVRGAVIRIDDITEKVMLEELIVQSEKMMSVGGMAAGMAHEINNPLAGIMQISEVMQNRLNKKLDVKASLKAAADAGVDIESIRHFLELRGIPKMLYTIHDSCQRVAVIVHNMLTFARKENDIGELNDITEILDSCIELSAIDYDLERDLDFKKIRIEKEYDENLPKVKCNRNKIQQVFMNILKNGAEAMLSDTLQNKSRFIIRCKYLPYEKLIHIEIEDNGPGMDQETKKKVFEPFFTTKGTRKGTGLGLSVSFFIITKTHNGKMFVQSSKGNGTKFIIQLPVLESFK